MASTRPSTQRISVTRSSAATICISDVPGFVKQVSIPPATSLPTRLSAPFICDYLFTIYALDKILNADLKKGKSGCTIPTAREGATCSLNSTRMGGYDHGTFCSSPANRKSHLLFRLDRPAMRGIGAF